MPLIECAKAAGKRIAFPLCIENGGLRLFVPNNGADSFASGSYGILEPKPEDSTEVFAEDIDLIIVPAVAFTKECGRLGQGRILRPPVEENGRIHGRRRVRFPTLRKPSR